MPDKDDPVTGRDMLAHCAYADDRHIRTRLAFWAHSTKAYPEGWRMSYVDWDGTGTIVDVGCGNARELKYLVASGKCRNGIGVDLSAGMLASAQGPLATDGLSFVQGDAEHLPVRAGAADAVLAMHMLYHVPNPEQAIAELRRVVRAGGTVLVSTVGARDLAGLRELFDSVASEHLGRRVEALPPLGFTLDNGGVLLGRHFNDVTLHTDENELILSDAQVAVDYMDSMRDPVVAHLGPDLDFEVALSALRQRIDERIRKCGSFVTHGYSGMFVCRE
ncbi:MAG TPA: methyltransferase domain-containing protein [Acidimicrobiales bacterium]|nr:methyltransferase domain-containing protein [Acidimicrobiales bacterium]